MFFGKSGGGPEEIKQEALLPLLDSQFDRKMESLESRASRLIKNIDASKKAFATACDDFERLQREPDIEYRYVSSTTYVKDLKSSYVTALKRIVSSGRPDIEYATTYHKYEAELDSAQTMINEVLRTNKTFKLVLDGYANHLDKFKKSFSTIEEYVTELRLEVNARGADLDRYNDVQSHVQTLLSLSDELQLMEKEIREIESEPVSHEKQVKGADMNVIRDAIAEKKKQVAEIEKRIADSRSGISMLLASVDKAARKHDHLSASKFKLASFIEDPKSIAQYYASFISEIEALAADLESGKIEVKNNAEVLKSIQAIVSGRIKDHIESADSLQASKVPVEAEVRDLERTMREVEQAEAGRHGREDTLTRIRNRISSIKDSRLIEKDTVERLFLAHYGKRLQIKLE